MPADFTCTFKIRCLWNSGHILPPLLKISLGKISWFDLKTIQYSIEKARMSPRKTRTFNQWQSMQKAKSNGKGERRSFFPACQLERARMLGFLARHVAAVKGNKGSEGSFPFDLDVLSRKKLFQLCSPKSVIVGPF